QVEMTGDERIKNVKGAFSLRRPAEVESMHVVLVDDVFTTGGHLQECAAVLKKAGAAHVTALTLARAI
ncbi:MAG TPA: phosphoribosyltransferase family protein, partial [Nitrospirota bacterium]